PQTMEIRRLLALAEQSLQDFRLTSPAGDNALGYYEQVLSLVPFHPEAEKGVQRVADAYVELAKIAMERGRHRQARRYVRLGLAVVPDHDGLLRLAKRR
ncbi:MAG: serine/threonine protein kinase, partial [Candidatus Competibacterales bacterium]